MTDKKDDRREDETKPATEAPVRGPAEDVSPATKPRAEAKAREAAPIEDPESDEDIAAQRELIDETLAAGATVVASDGTVEITALDPVAVTADLWVPHLGKKMYSEKVLFKLGDVTESAVIEGFALLDNEDNQVAWCPLPEPIVVRPNTTVGVEDSIVF